MVKKQLANAGDSSLIPGSGRSPGGGMATHCSILAWDNSTDRGAWKTTYSPWDHKELDTTKQLRHNNTVALYPKLPSRSEKTSHKVGDSVCHTNQLRKEENPRVDGCYPYASARKICDPKDDQTKTRFSGEET